MMCNFNVKIMVKVNILGTEINKINYQETLLKIEEFVADQKQHYIVTPNPEIILKASRDIYYRGILNNASLSLADGFGLILGSWFLGDPLYHRVTGIDLTYKINELAAHKGYKVFLLGGREGSAETSKTKLELKYKGLNIVGAEEGFSNIQKITPEENNRIIEKIKDSQAQILLVAYGAPWQEKWIWENISKIPNIKIAMGVGGTFDFISGKILRAPQAFRKVGIEWLWRLFIEPSRINRILNATLKYSWYLILWSIHIQKSFRKNVLGVILNQNNEFLVLNRKDDPNHWQFPQGGVEKDESEEEAILKEVYEETGLKKVKIIKKLDELHKYYFMPEMIKPKSERMPHYYKTAGQNQRIFILKQTENEEPNPQEELQNHKWVKKEELKDHIHIIRHQSLNIMLKEINKYIK